MGGTRYIEHDDYPLDDKQDSSKKTLFETTADILKMSPADVKRHCINMTEAELANYTPESLAKEISDQWWIRR